MTQNSATKQRHAKFTSSAGIVSVAVMGSRMMGLVREMVLAALFEAGTALDAFYAAFFIPNLFRDLFGEGILSKAFITIFTETEIREGEATSWRLANITFSTLVVALGILTLLGIFAAPLIVDVVFHGDGFQNVPLPSESSFGMSSKRDLTVHLTRIMFPFILLVSLAALAMGVLNSKGRFFIPASASTFFNLGSVLVGVAGYYIAPRWGQHPVVGMAIGVLVGGMLQFLIQIPSLRRVGFHYRPALNFRDPGLVRIMHLIGPMILGAAAVQINVLINKSFASYGEGWIAWLQQSFRLIHLPIGMFGVAISTVTLPVLSRATAHQDMKEYREAIAHAFRLMVLLTVPASVGLIVLREPIIRLIYERGMFDPNSTRQVANALLYYALGLCSFSAVKIATDGFYALKDTRTPVIVSFIAICMNLLLNYLFIVRLHWDHRSLALATSCSLTVNSMTLLWLLRRRVDGIGGRSILIVLGKVLLASGMMGYVAWWCSTRIAVQWGTTGVLVRLSQVGVSITVGVFVLTVAYHFLRISEFWELVQMIRQPNDKDEA